MAFKKFLFLISACLLISSCQTNPEKQCLKLAKDFQRAHHQILTQGLKKKNLSLIFMPTKENILSLNDLYNKYHKQLSNLDTTQISEKGRLAYLKTTTALRNLKQQIKGYEQRASAYNILPYIKQVSLNGDHPPDDIAIQLIELLNMCPAYYELATANLNQVPATDFEMANTNHIRTVTYLKNDLPLLMEKWSLSPENKNELTSGIESTILAVKQYIAWCESKRVETF